MDGWYPPAIDNHAPTDGGAFTGPVTVGVLHTTESSGFSPSSKSYFGHSSYPHFTVLNDRGTFRSYQHISIRRAARALRNTSGGVQTNREGAIQIEVVGKATKPFTADPVLTAGLRDLMRWVEAQTSIPKASSVTWTSYPTSYGLKAVQRLSPSAWESYRGWLGHQHVPENTHGDPGAIAVSTLLHSSPRPSDAPAPTSSAHMTPPRKAPSMFLIRRTGTAAVYETPGTRDSVKKWVSSTEELKRKGYTGADVTDLPDGHWLLSLPVIGIDADPKHR